MIATGTDDGQLALLYQSGKAGKAVSIAWPINQARSDNGHWRLPVLDQLLKCTFARYLAAAVRVLLSAICGRLVNSFTYNKAMYIYRTDMHESSHPCRQCNLRQALSSQH